MKKFGAILLTFMMVISLITIPASAEGETITFDALEDATDYFYDHGGVAKESLYDNLMLRPNGEWTSYDVSDLAKGTYSLSITYVATNLKSTDCVGLLEWFIDDELVLKTKHSYVTGGWNTTPVASGTLGNIYIGENADLLKMRNSATQNIMVDTITLTFDAIV